MTKYCYFHLLFSILLCSMFTLADVHAQTVTYTAAADIVNPDRGFYTPIHTHTSSFTPLSLSVLQFSYTTSPNTSCGSSACPPYGDAPKSRILAHISQIKPYLQNNEDVIAAVQQGFIGVWGEQYYTDYYDEYSSL